jgi:hypothetical protein
MSSTRAGGYRGRGPISDLVEVERPPRRRPFPLTHLVLHRVSHIGNDSIRKGTPPPRLPQQRPA